MTTRAKIVEKIKKIKIDVLQMVTAAIEIDIFMSRKAKKTKNVCMFESKGKYSINNNL